MYAELILWGIIFAVTVIAELSTMQLVSIWFAAGSLASFIAALADLNLMWQMIIFVAVSLILLIATRPLLKKISISKAEPTNADLNIGRTAVIIEEVNSEKGTGRARLSGVDWRAVSADGSVIPIDSVVKITELKGATLYVNLVKETIK